MTERTKAHWKLAGSLGTILAILTFAFTAGARVSRSDADMSSKLPIERFVAESARQAQKDTLVRRDLGEIKAGVHVLLCQQHLTAPCP